MASVARVVEQLAMSVAIKRFLVVVVLLLAPGAAAALSNLCSAGPRDGQACTQRSDCPQARITKTCLTGTDPCRAQCRRSGSDKRLGEALERVMVTRFPLTRPCLSRYRRGRSCNRGDG